MTTRRFARGGQLLLVSAASLCVACATAITLASLPQETRDQIQTHRYDAPDSLLYSAVLSALMDKGYPIQVSDRVGGLIQTEPSTGPCLGYERFSSEGYKTTPEVLAGIHFSYRNRVTARVNEGVARLNIMWERCRVQGSSLHPAQSSYVAFSPDTATARKAYDSVFVAIARRLNP